MKGRAGESVDWALAIRAGWVSLDRTLFYALVLPLAISRVVGLGVANSKCGSKSSCPRMFLEAW